MRKLGLRTQLRPLPPTPSNSGLYYKYFQTGKGTTQRLFCTSYILETSQAMAVVGRRAAAKAKGGAETFRVGRSAAQIKDFSSRLPRLSCF